MKNLKTILIAALLLYSSNVLMAQELKEYVTVNIILGNSVVGTAYIIVYPDGKTESGKFKEASVRNMETNGITFNNIFNQLGKKGYKLVSSNGGDYYTSYIFEKQ